MSIWLSGCTSWFASHISSFDSRPISVQTVDLFNQRAVSTLSKNSWKGDWLFRRDRLELVDRELRSTRPDLIVFQELMAKTGSPSESDRNLLGSGALSGYDWYVERVAEYRDTQEGEFHAVAAGLPLSISPLNQELAKNWPVGLDGQLSLTIFELEDQPIAVFNVQMPSGSKGVQLWYRFIEDRMSEVLADKRLCAQRVLVAGYLPGGLGIKQYQSLLASKQLKDVSEGYCEIASDCFTATPLNDIFLAIAGGQSPAQVDRILVHSSALVLSSSLVFKTSDATSRYGKKYGLAKLWSSARFGWGATLRLARCEESDFLHPVTQN